MAVGYPTGHTVRVATRDLEVTVRTGSAKPACLRDDDPHRVCFTTTGRVPRSIWMTTGSWVCRRYSSAYEPQRAHRHYSAAWLGSSDVPTTCIPRWSPQAPPEDEPERSTASHPRTKCPRCAARGSSAPPDVAVHAPVSSRVCGAGTGSAIHAYRGGPPSRGSTATPANNPHAPQ